MMYKRLLRPLKKQSHFIFGARGTGKSTWLRANLENKTDLWLDFLNLQTEADYARDPQLLSQQLAGLKKTEGLVVIDEVQKVPRILDVVHSEIEKTQFQFILSGSSARKLKRGAANLLAGRAFERHMHPLSSFELGPDFQLEKALKFGTLPKTSELDNEACKEYLKSYVNVYLKEEIQLEQLVRKMDPFRRFLEVAAQTSGNILNYSRLARDIASDASSTKNYFQILEDTLVGFFLDPFHSSIRKRLSKTPKFYLFDNGVMQAIERKLHLDLVPSNYEYGRLFEHWLIQETFRLNQYLQKDYQLMYLRTKDDVEVDLVMERPGEPLYLIEIKSAQHVTQDHIRSLVSIKKDLPKAKALLFSQEKQTKILNGVECMHWQEGLKRIFEI